MQKELNKESFDKVKMYIMEDQGRYSFESFLKEKNLLEDSKHKGDSIVIKCPFHEDESPSCGIALDKKIYNCFSCGRGGNYLGFIKEYKSVVEGHTLALPTLVDNILKSDRIMQGVLGLQTIFKTDNIISTMDNFTVRKPNIKRGNSEPKSFIEYAINLKNRHAPDKEIMEFISNIQSGLSISDIIKYSKTSSEPKNLEDDELTLSDSDLNMFDIASLLGRK